MTDLEEQVKKVETEESSKPAPRKKKSANPIMFEYQVPQPGSDLIL